MIRDFEPHFADFIQTLDASNYTMVLAGLISVASDDVDKFLHKITPIIFGEWDDLVKGPSTTVSVLADACVPLHT